MSGDQVPNRSANRISIDMRMSATALLPDAATHRSSKREKSAMNERVPADLSM
jgi:hypothetical protein